MSKLVFDKTGEHFYETGVKNCVLYSYADSAQDVTVGQKTISTNYAPGVAWNGITAITEKPSGAEATALYADDQKYLNIIAAEDFGVTIEAYTYPEQFGECDGSAAFADNVPGVHIGQQTRKMFGLCYKTVVGDDVNGNTSGRYKLHLVYGCKAAPSERGYATINDSPEAITMSWEVSTTPENVTGFKATAHIEIDSGLANATKLAELEKFLYGDTSNNACLPLPDEIKDLMTATA